ncbi:MAG TPA: hypothetical protein VGO76_16475 [Luteibacter sp.]|jgi:hypothetical protein|nr:hypothetical protein [Luteibacter sp.]
MRAALIAAAELLVLGAWIMLFGGQPLWLGLILLVALNLIAFRVMRGRRRPRVNGTLAVPPATGDTAGAPLTPPAQLRAATAARVRFLARGELGMGGPVDGDYLLPGGLAVIGGCAEDAVLGPDGRWFIAASPRSRYTDSCDYVLDAERRLLWRLPDWRQVGWRQNDPWVAPVGGGEPRPLRDVLESESQLPMDYVACADVWLPRDVFERCQPPSLDTGPGTAPPLALRKAMPPSLAALDDPLTFLQDKRYQLWMDGRDSGLLVQGGDDLCWRDDGSALAVRAIAPTGYRCSWRLWTKAEGWRELVPWNVRPDEPVVVPGDPQSLDGSFLRIAGYLTEHGRRGWPDSWVGIGAGQPASALYRGGGVHSDVTVVDGFEPSLALRVRTEPQRTPRICMTLDGKSRWLESGRVRIVPIVASDDGRQVRYRYEGPGWSIEDALLEHRVSPDGHWWTAIAAAVEPALPRRLLALDTRTGKVHALDLPYPLLSLDSITDGELQATVLLGWHAGKASPGPLSSFESLPTVPAQDIPFVLARASREGYFRLRAQRIALLAAGPALLPDWHVPTGPIAANAAVELLLPAPHGNDAAWLFGVDTSWRDGRLDPRLPRSGYLRTRGGLAMEDIAPSLLWTADGRYLLFTQWRRRDDHRELAEDEWVLHVFDNQARELFRLPRAPGCLPQLEGIHHGSLRMKVYERPWIEPGERPRRVDLAWAQMLETGLRVPLHEAQGLYFRKGAVKDAARWAAMAFPAQVP